MKNPDPLEALKALEAELGESVLYRATGRFLAAQGLPTLPLDSWGLIALTATRVTFRHFPQAHPLFGGRDAEQKFEVRRDQFQTCEARIPGLLAKIFSGAQNHLALVGPERWVNFELADNPQRFVDAWNMPSP